MGIIAERRADEHGSLAAAVDGEATLRGEAGESAASDGADARYGVDDDEGILCVIEIEAVVLVEELGEMIEEIEPPDGVGEDLWRWEKA